VILGVDLDSFLGMILDFKGFPGIIRVRNWLDESVPCELVLADGSCFQSVSSK